MQRYLEPSNHLIVWIIATKKKKKRQTCPRGEKYFTIILGLEFGYKYQSVYVKFVLCKKRNKLDGWKRSCKRQHCELLGFCQLN